MAHSGEAAPSARPRMCHPKGKRVDAESPAQDEDGCGGHRRVLVLAANRGSDGGGCAGRNAASLPKGITCIWMPTPNAHSYTVIDDRHLVIQAAHGAFYLLTLSRHCTELRTSLQIGLARRDGQLCAPGDSIVSGNDRCPIQYIEGVASEAEAEAVVDGRQAAGKARRTPPPGH